MMADASVVASASSGGADDGVVFIADPASSPNLERQNQSRAGKKHLPKEAYNILKDYFFNVNQFPKKRERLELAAKVNSVLGCEAYTQENVSGYFGNLRKRHRQTSTVVVKRELVEEPLSLGAGTDISATNGTTSVVNPHPESCSAPLPSISAAGAGSSISGHLASTGPRGSVSALNPLSGKTQKKRTRIKAEGYKMLSDFFHTVSRNPTAAQKAELLASVTSMKGCEGYTLANLTAYFSRMRIERKGAVPFVKAESPEPQMNAALYSEQGPPSAASLVLRPAPEPETVPEPEPLLATPPSSILRLVPSVPQPPLSSPLPSSGSQFNVFSIYEPNASISLAPLLPPVRTRAALRQSHVSPRTTGSGPQATPREAEHHAPRHPRASVLHPSSSIDSGAVLAGAPAAPDHAGETVKTNNNAVHGLSDHDPVPTPSPKKKKKPKAEAASNPEQKPQPRALTDAALKILDDYYANVTPHPNMAQSTALAAHVCAHPDGGRCTVKQVRRYFKKRRGEAQREAPKAERMGAGPEEPRLVPVAVVEPGAGVKFGQLAPEVANVGPVAGGVGSALGSSSLSLPGSDGGGVAQNGDQALPDVSMDDSDTRENREPEDTARGSPKPDHDGERSDVRAQIPAAEEERMDIAVEFDGDVGNAESCPELGVELDPSFQAQVPAEEERADAEIVLDRFVEGPELVEERHQASPLKPSDSLCEVAAPEAGPADLAATSAASPSAPGGGGDGEGSVDEAMLDMPTDDICENQEPDRAVPASPRSDHDGERPDDCARMTAEEERMDVRIETESEHAETGPLEPVAEVEPDLNLNSGAPVCEVMSDTIPEDEDLVEPSALSSPALGGKDEDGIDDPSTPEISVCTLELDTLPEEDPEEGVLDGVAPEEVASEEEVPGDVMPLGVVLGSPQPNHGDADTDIPMDVDSGNPPASVQVDVFGLAMQLQRVFSKPPALDGGHPTTFADFATWLQTRNVGVVCAPS